MIFGWPGPKELKQHSVPALALPSASLSASFLGRFSLSEVDRILYLKIHLPSKKGLQSNRLGPMPTPGPTLGLGYAAGPSDLFQGERWGPGSRVPPGGQAQIPKPQDEFCYKKGKND